MHDHHITAFRSELFLRLYPDGGLGASSESGLSIARGDTRPAQIINSDVRESDIAAVTEVINDPIGENLTFADSKGGNAEEKRDPPRNNSCAVIGTSCVMILVLLI